MQWNDVSISSRSFIISDIKDDLHRIQTLKSGKITIGLHLTCFLDKFLFFGDIQYTFPNTVYRLYRLCQACLKSMVTTKIYLDSAINYNYKKAYETKENTITA